MHTCFRFAVLLLLAVLVLSLLFSRARSRARPGSSTTIGASATSGGCVRRSWVARARPMWRGFPANTSFGLWGLRAHFRGPSGAVLLLKRPSAGVLSVRNQTSSGYGGPAGVLLDRQHGVLHNDRGPRPSGNRVQQRGARIPRNTTVTLG